MRDIDKLKELLPEGHLLREETVEEILCGNATLVIDWNEDGSINFSEDFFQKPTNLTVSGQLNGETFAMAFRNIYTAFRIHQHI